MNYFLTAIMQSLSELSNNNNKNKYNYNNDNIRKPKINNISNNDNYGLYVELRNDNKTILFD